MSTQNERLAAIIVFNVRNIWNTVSENVQNVRLQGGIGPML